MRHVTKQTAVLEFLGENNIHIMEWPPQSPDLNPIENLWVSFIVAFHAQFIRMFNYPSKSLEARYRYGEVLQQVWYELGQHVIDALIELMPKRVHTVIEAEGGWTKY